MRSCCTTFQNIVTIYYRNIKGPKLLHNCMILFTLNQKHFYPRRNMYWCRTSDYDVLLCLEPVLLLDGKYGYLISNLCDDTLFPSHTPHSPSGEGHQTCPRFTTIRSYGQQLGQTIITGPFRQIDPLQELKLSGQCH